MMRVKKVYNKQYSNFFNIYRYTKKQKMNVLALCMDYLRKIKEF